jgi:hypothetical protein
MIRNVDKDARKRPYSKPELKQVQFVMEEIAFLGCKYPSPKVGRDQSNHLRTCLSNHCKQLYTAT